jgi:hypothetical protein
MAKKLESKAALPPLPVDPANQAQRQVIGRNEWREYFAVSTPVALISYGAKPVIEPDNCNVRFAPQ